MIDNEAVGQLFTTNGKDAWRCITYCEYPTVTFENLETKEQRGGATHSLNVMVFKRLTMEEPT